MPELDDVEVRNGVPGRLRYVWAIWSPVDARWCDVVRWSRAEAWKAKAQADRLSKFWPFPMEVVEVFAPVDDTVDTAIADALAHLPPSEIRVTPEGLVS